MKRLIVLVSMACLLLQAGCCPSSLVLGLRLLGLAQQAAPQQAAQAAPQQ